MKLPNLEPASKNSIDEKAGRSQQLRIKTAN